jgi:hypothetical protein
VPGDSAPELEYRVQVRTATCTSVAASGNTQGICGEYTTCSKYICVP